MPLSTIHGQRWRRALTLAALTAVALLAGAGVAAAHVTVNPSDATAGDEAIALTFRVPNNLPARERSGSPSPFRPITPSPTWP